MGNVEQVYKISIHGSGHKERQGEGPESGRQSKSGTSQIWFGVFYECFKQSNMVRQFFRKLFLKENVKKEEIVHKK